MRTSLLALTGLFLGCGGGERPPAADTAASSAASTPQRLATAEGFSTPESVLFDSDQGVWFVSNINGSPSGRDGNGFISRMTSDGVVDSLHFIQGGRGGAKLDAPKGLAITGDTLWVADISVLRGFNRKTGAPVATIDFGKQALFLNDVVAIPDSSLILTDTGIIIADSMTHPGPDRVFRVKGRTITISAEGAHLQGPNGVAYDDKLDRVIMVPFGGTTIFTAKEGSGAIPLGLGPGQQDGVVVLDGRILVSSWADSSVSEIGPNGITKVITGVPSPADIGLDRGGRRLAIPLFTQNRVEIWKIP